jgi:IS30 family transposase
MKFKQISIQEREKIQEMLWQNVSVRSIAATIDRSPSSVSREIRRSKPPFRNRYTPRVAHERAILKRSSRGRKLRLKSGFVRRYVVAGLKFGLSPEQIAGRLHIEHPEESISHEAIYQYIYTQVHQEGSGYMRRGYHDLRPYLKRRHRIRVRKGMRRCQRIGRPHGPSIDIRPKEVETRKNIGHWEGDSMVSTQSTVSLNTLVERKTGLVFITKITDRTATATSNAVVHRLSALPHEVRKTLTTDNGSENANFAELTDKLNISCFFAHPYHSWERGTNENTNGLIRWYFPKRTDFATISDDTIKAVENALNNRPRKRLGWKTPLEAFNESVAIKG